MSDADAFAGKVRSAAIAGWWMLLVATGFMVVNWLGYIIVIRTRPDFLLAFWGSSRDWPIGWGEVQMIWFQMAATFKVIVWVLALVVIWLSLWARGLRKAQS